MDNDPFQNQLKNSNSTAQDSNSQASNFQDNDKLYRYIFKNCSVRGEWVKLDATFQNCFNYKSYPQPVQNLLGEMLVATSLLTATLKFEGEITVQIQGDGILSFAVVNGDNQQRMRALARVNSEKGEVLPNMSFQDLVGKGMLVITIAPKRGERYQGIVELVNNSIVDSLEQYFERSEQLPTKFIIKTAENKVGGLMLQKMPTEDWDPYNFEHLVTLAETTTAEELLNLSANEMLYRLFHEEEVEIYPAEAVQFYCGCSKTRSAHALLMLGQEELSKIFAEHNGEIATKCECCGREYRFTSKSLDKFNN